MPGVTDPMLAALAEGQRHFGRFFLLRVAGASTRGVVWVARDEANARSVALKFLPDPLARDGAVRAELKTALARGRTLPAEVFVPARELHEDGPRAAISTELVEGNALGALREVRLNGCLDAAELLAWVEPLGAAFADAPLPHGALHPWHLVLTPQGKVKVLDFEVAHLLSEAADRHRIGGGRRESRALLYASPQLRGGAPAHRSDDVYALGATLYDLLAGAPPYSREQLSATGPLGAPLPIRERRAAHDCWGAPVPPAWEETLAACLATDPGKRPESLAVLIDRLRSGLGTAENKPPTADPAPPAESAGFDKTLLRAGRNLTAAAYQGKLSESAEKLPGTPERARKPAGSPSKSPLRLSEPPGSLSQSSGTLPESSSTLPELSSNLSKSSGSPSESSVSPPKSSPGLSGPPAWSAPTGAITATLPEVDAARALARQRTHFRGALIALACLGVVVQAARMVSERVLPPVLPEVRRAPTTRLNAIASPPPAPAAAPDTPAVVAENSAAPPEMPPPPPAEAAEQADAPPGTVRSPASSPLPDASIASAAPDAPDVPASARAEPVSSSKPPKLGQRWINSLGMPFAPVTKLRVLVATWETRMRDYAAYANATNTTWKFPELELEHPVVNISYLEAMRFCEWLTKTEVAAGLLKPGQHYRLPTDLEWSAAAGVPAETGATLRERDDPEDKVFPWGVQWPAPPTAGNFRGLNASGADAGGPARPGDPYEQSAPVGSFLPNRFGIFDLAGNAAEMVSDFIAPELGLHATRGGSFEDAGQRALRLRARGVGENDRGGAPHIGFRIVLDPAIAR